MTSPLYDTDLERRTVAALLRQPALLVDVDDLAVADLVDFHAIEALSAMRNLQSAGLPITLEAVRAERLALGHEGAREQPADYPPSWLDALAVLPLPAELPVADWATQIHQLAFLRETAIEADEVAIRIDDEVTDFAIRDLDPPALHVVRDVAPLRPAVDWTSLLLLRDNRAPRRAYHNTAVFVRHHPEFAGRWSYDEMTLSPWFDDKVMSPEMVHHIRAQADCRLGYTPSPADVEAALVVAAKERSFHPIRTYLRTPQWDGVQRLPTMARDYLGSDDPLHAEIVHMFMISAVARVMRPGCKVDTALMLVGHQGYFKSSFFIVLGGQWHADSYIDITSKDGAMQLHAAWIYELAELENVVGAAKESRLKAWISSATDLYRAPYTKPTLPKPRGTVLCATTNKAQFLTDDTGSRRDWIVAVSKRIPIELLAANRDQLWAEAVHRYGTADLSPTRAHPSCPGERWWLDDASERARETANRQFQEDDSWLEPISNYLSSPAHMRTTITEALRDGVGMDVSRHDRWAQMRASRILKTLGWTRQRESTGHRDWYYQRPDVLL